MTDAAAVADGALTPQALRALCRAGRWRGATAGVAMRHVQANLIALPAEAAFEFLLFCQRNPKPCPLVEVLEAGRLEPACAPGADVRSDLPGYRVLEDGRWTDDVADVTERWRSDLVTFLIGCSFTFEAALGAAGIGLRHLQQARNVAMYRTRVACRPAGRFRGDLVVSMRPIRAADVARAVEISARFPEVHGAPVHVGAPEALGIADLGRPDFGDPVAIEPGELPVFWACGVTPQVVAEASGVPFCITHAPGKMFVTDLACPA